MKGIRYNSIGKASRMTGESETRIRIKLNNNTPVFVLKFLNQTWL